jgi:hypothetical protein
LEEISDGRGHARCKISQEVILELLEIRSNRDLTAHRPEAGRATGHSYLVSCRQFMSVLAGWRKSDGKRNQTDESGKTLGFMTLQADQIWVTEAEITQIVGAIQSAHSPVTLATPAADSEV